MSRLRNFLMLALAAVLVALGLAGCNKNHEHPFSEHPSSEHPTTEHQAAEHPG